MSQAESTFIIACPSCGTGNRVPASSEGKRGTCGSCRALLPPLYTTPLPLTDRSFDAFMRDYPGPIVAEFWASWCPHCLRFAPIVREAAAELAGKCAVVQINSEENPGLASRFAIQGIPALLFLRKGDVIDRVGGALAKGALLDWCRRHLR